MTKVFVYGTLMRGYGNNRLMKGQTYLGKGTTLPLYKLFAVGGFPGMKMPMYDGVAVEGEVWLVDDGCLARLDSLEGVPVMYKRCDALLQDHEDVQTYIYQYDTDRYDECGPRWSGGFNRCETCDHSDPDDPGQVTACNNCQQRQ